MGLLPATNAEQEPLVDTSRKGEYASRAVLAQGLGHTWPAKFKGCGASVLFSWINPIMALGSARPLSKWLDEQRKYPTQPSLKWALARTYGWQTFHAGWLGLINDSLQFVGPLMIKAIVSFLSDPTAPLSLGLFYTAIVFVSGAAQSLALCNYTFVCSEMGMQVRSAVSTSVYRKSLVLSAAARQKKTTGEITNLMSVDAQRLQDLAGTIHGVLFSLFSIVVSCVLLWHQIGVSMFAGLGVILFMFRTTRSISMSMRALQLSLMQVKDDRIKICSEVLSGMKVVKLQAWENAFTRRVMRFRMQELETLKTYIYTRTRASTLFMSIPSLVAIASFLCYVLLGNTLDVGTALTSLALFEILRFPMFMLPQVLNSIVEASVSTERLRDYFMEEERVIVGPGDLLEVGVKVVDADFSWDLKETTAPSGAEPTGPAPGVTAVRNVNLNATSGQLVAVVGHVGAGKSTLLSGILGDAKCTQGSVAVRGSVAYVSQQPFIQNASVRDNITFGATFDQKRYNEAIRVSSLERDLAMLPGGDFAEIGEKGINLSGGQRTRVAIARAVYQNADIYLLDDIFSAVDSHVGRDIYVQCVKTTLKSKLVLLVTHHLAYVSQCDSVLVLERGEVVEHGACDEVIAKNGVLAELLAMSRSHDQCGREEEENVDSVAVLNEGHIEVDAKRSRASLLKTDEGSTGGKSEHGRLLVDEDRATGEVVWPVYKWWIDAFGGYPAAAYVVFVYVTLQCINLLSTFWLSYWSVNAQGHKESQMNYLSVFIALNMLYAVGLYIRAIATYIRGLNASKILFEALLGRLLRAPATFFYTTPLGRILNRLSKDVYTIDEVITPTWSQLWSQVINVVFTLVAISFVTPVFMVITLPVMLGYFVSQRYFIKTSRELERLDSISRSPVFALLTETLDGLPSIRAFGAEQRFAQRNEEVLDRNQRAYFLNFSVNCWLSLRLEFAGTLVASFAALSAVFTHQTTDQAGATFAGLAGVSLSYAFTVTQSLNWSVRMLSQLQTQMVSVERIKNYSEMETEPALTSVGKLPLQAQWPSQGEIVFRNVSLRYRSGLPRVLRNLSFTVLPREKVGVVGRTGAGKSSLVIALMRLVELDSGAILVDGVNISELGLHEVRGNMSIIPQDPVLFSGTVRSNVDPFDQFSDEQIWASIRRALLGGSVGALDDRLDEQGSNFSLGERQLLCISRALLKRSRIILMDEATASIDTETDRKIQQSIREEFKDCTCLTIAHRINTILDSDRVLVMEKGEVREFDTPMALQKKTDGLFKSLLDHWRDRATA